MYYYCMNHTYAFGYFQAFSIIKTEFGLDPPLPAEELVFGKVSSPSVMSAYLTSLKDIIEKLTPTIGKDICDCIYGKLH